MNNLATAIRYATLCHLGQVRKFTGEPYIRHPERVMIRVINDRNIGGQEEPAMAAVLHDVVEDCDVKFLSTDTWGYKVPFWVDELTNVYTSKAFPDKRRSQRKTLEHQRLAGISDTGKIIKLYDVIDNLQSWFETAITDEMRGFGRVFSTESWDLMVALSTLELTYVTSELGSLSMKVRDACQ